MANGMFPVSVGSFIWLLVVVGSFSAALNPALEEEWREWKKTHAKEYLEGEESYRRAVWEENLRMIEEHNREASLGKHTYRMGLNQFGDLTDEEFSQRLNGFRPDEDTAEERGNVTVSQGSPTQDLPPEVDWREDGYVTKVKDQRDCKASWAFSATGALEGLHVNYTGELVSLSEQNLIDCSWRQRNRGCEYGTVRNALKYVAKNRGINSEKNYPYKGQVGACHYDPDDVEATCSSYKSVMPGSEQALQRAVARIGPISVNVAARKFKNYKSGIFSDPACGRNLNHAMLLVGYGTSREYGHEKDYWILKNSWGTRWGENGYMRLERGRNLCGVADDAVYPVHKSLRAGSLLKPLERQAVRH